MFFIFDWDGTLCDSAEKICTSMIHAAEELRLPELTAADVKNIIGLGLPEAVMTLFPNITDRDVKAVCDAYSRNFVIADEIPSSLFPGVQSTMDALRDAGHHLAVATGKSRKGLDRVLKNMFLDDYFDATRCADETASKPQPKMLYELVSEMAFSIEDSVMIGDTEFDMEMARRADMPKIAVDYGAHHIDRLKGYEPIICVSQFEEIAEWAL